MPLAALGMNLPSSGYQQRADGQGRTGGQETMGAAQYGKIRS